jgi:hypothetical protein
VASTSNLRQQTLITPGPPLEGTGGPRVAKFAAETEGFSALVRAAYPLASLRGTTRALSAIDPLTRGRDLQQGHVFLVGVSGDKSSNPKSRFSW